MPTSHPVCYPSTADLKSGDLLFPKKPGDVVIASLDAEEAWGSLAAIDRVGLQGKQLKMRVGDLLDSPDEGDALALGYVRQWQERVAVLRSHDKTLASDKLEDLSDLAVQDLLHLGRSLMVPLADTLGQEWSRLPFTFGHVAMAFEENDQWYVMEAGCTDYSHYRVCISPYLDDEDSDRQPGQTRGWAKRRANLGQCTWSARHKALKPEHLALILNHCKNFLSVPYGILEPGMMSNPNRIYCTELLQRGFAQASLRLDERQKWSWGFAPLTAVFDWLSSINKQAQILDHFPLLSPKMIYTAKSIKPVFKPTDANGKLLSYV